MADITPMMQQYFSIKEKCPDSILFYRLGDFYEMFFEDAKLASEELELVLTGRDWGQEERAPMCGVPYHSCESYIARLVSRGYKVAICEQVEDPKTAKGIVKRDIVRVITPGTVTDSSMLDEQKNNYIGAYFNREGKIGLCFADISTGAVYATSLAGPAAVQHACSDLGRFAPREMVLCGSVGQEDPVCAFLTQRLGCNQERVEEPAWEQALEQVRAQFGAAADGYTRLDAGREMMLALAGLLTYLNETQRGNLSGLCELSLYQQEQFMELDVTAQRNLELCETMRGKEKKGSLLWVLDRTNTAMGARLLRRWLQKPLLNPVYIEHRLDAVEKLVEDVVQRDTLDEYLSGVLDMERLISKVSYGTANGRDLRSLYAAIGALPGIHATLAAFSSSRLLCEIRDQLDLLTDIRELIDRAIVEEPPFSLREGGIIQSDFHEEIAALRDAASGGKEKIAAIEQRERERTGIHKLKVGYNKVFGYYIEVTKANLAQVPDDYIRKQTLANCERFVTPELKDYESMVLGSQERLVSLEYTLFCQVRDEIAGQVQRVLRSAQAVAQVDVLLSLAKTAARNHYVRPTVDLSDVLDIKEGRHPVVERVLTDSVFIPNDIYLDRGENRVAIITGPNMAGKSTYMRQAALIAILAQMGSFVPAKSARVGVIDRVFTRVGASDDLTSGQSTFMVEMNEVATILREATGKSLLILDEIGRGTSTFDGMSIARAVMEYVADRKKLGARALFSTHYHELTVLEQLVEGVKNYNIAVKKRGDDITFLRKIVRGSADESYGIEVAKLAGVPGTVIRRAKEVLRELEAGGGETKMPAAVQAAPEEEEAQVSLPDLRDRQVADQLRQVDVDTLTPIEALTLLYQLKQSL